MRWVAATPCPLDVFRAAACGKALLWLQIETSMVLNSGNHPSHKAMGNFVDYRRPNHANGNATAQSAAIEKNAAPPYLA
jgi:hypothetical protein